MEETKVIEDLRKKEVWENLGWLLHPNNRKRLKNFGEDSYLIDRYGRKSQKEKVYINIGASADDSEDEAREKLTHFEPICNDFGAAFGRRTKELFGSNFDIIVSTGGCDFIGYWILKSAKEINPDLFTVALYPSGEKGREDPVQDNIKHLSPYDFIIGTGMDIQVRSVLVGTGDILIICHGGSGSAIEMSTNIDQQGITALWNIEGSRWGVVKGAPEMWKKNYRNSPAIFFRNTDYHHLIERSFKEFEANNESLYGKLSAVVLYELCPGDDVAEKEHVAVFNIRGCEKPVTYYHRGRRHHPMRQLVFKDKNPEELIADFQSTNKGLTKMMEEKELDSPHYRGKLFMLPKKYLDDGSAMRAMQNMANNLEGKLFYDYRFIT